MKKRNAIYLTLLIFVAIGVITDWFFWQGAPATYTLNDFVQMIGIIVLSSWWQIADAEERAVQRSNLSKYATFGFAPIGSAIYLYQSRDWKSATVSFLAFWAGVILVVIAAEYVGYWLVVQGVFEAS